MAKPRQAGYQDAFKVFGKGCVLNRVLITRPEPGATQTATRVAALGFLPVVTPLFSIIPLSRGLPLPSRVAATVLTSRNAVPACPPACFDRPVFTVGSATAACARAAGFRQVIDADADASALPALIARAIVPNRQTLFLPTARRQGIELTRALRQQGFRVMRRAAYDSAAVDTLPSETAAHLRGEDVMAALFFSTESARVFVRLVRAAGLAESVADVTAVSISERSAMPLRALPWRRINVAAKPNQDAMLVLLK